MLRFYDLRWNDFPLEISLLVFSSPDGREQGYLAESPNYHATSGSHVLFLSNYSILIENVNTFIHFKDGICQFSSLCLNSSNPDYRHKKVS